MVRPNSVCICTTSAGPPNWAFVESVFYMRTPGPKLFKRIAGIQGTDDGRNRGVDWFLKYTDFEWLWILDTDAKVHHETLTRLLSWDAKFVSALAFQRMPPFTPVVYTEVNPAGPVSFGRPISRVIEWIAKHPELLSQERAIVLDPKPDDALWKVLRGGSHCCLVHRSVLEAIEPPWFVREGPQAKSGYGADFVFHRKAREVGFETYVDMSVVAGHTTGDLVIGALDFAVWNAVGAWGSAGEHAEIVLAFPATPFLRYKEKEE